MYNFQVELKSHFKLQASEKQSIQDTTSELKATLHP